MLVLDIHNIWALHFFIGFALEFQRVTLLTGSEPTYIDKGSSGDYIHDLLHAVANWHRPQTTAVFTVPHSVAERHRTYKEHNINYINNYRVSD